MGLGNMRFRFIARLGRRKNPPKSNDSSNSSNRLNSKGKSIIVLGIVMAVIGFVGAIYYGSQFVKEEVNGGATLPYTTPSQMKNLSSMDFEIVFVVIAIIGFGILTYEFVGRIDKSLDYYPNWWMIHKQHVIESSYRCEECGKSFCSRGELDEHIHQIHGIYLWHDEIAIQSITRLDIRIEEG